MRGPFDALFGIDDALGEVVASATQPALGAIKLAWWREALERLDSQPPPAEPRLQAVAAQLLSRGIRGGEIAELVPGWATLLDESPDSGLVAGRGAVLFGLAARLLGVEFDGMAAAGGLYAAVDAARRLHDRGRLSAAEHLGRARFPRQARPLTALAALAARDVKRPQDDSWEPQATPGRSFTILRHRLTGVV